MSGNIGQAKGRCAELLINTRVALKARMSALHPEVEWMDGHKDYVVKLTDNLLPGITLNMFQEEFGSGAGGELTWYERNGTLRPPKMHAVHSSSALVVNCFA